nr:MAG TPA: putative nucleotidyltransferase [Caudoviricetes sp.]
MTIDEIKKKISGEEYDFLRTDKHLGNKIVLLGLGGSYSYGTNVETSDLDMRGIALNTKEEILTNERFEQFENKTTDTTIYGFNKIIKLLSNCNPNVIELLGLKLEHYLYISPIGYELLDNSHLFLSKKAAQAFGGYATSQLRRLDNKAVRTVDQEHRENHILNSIYNAAESFPEKYFEYPEDSIKLYLDDSIQEDMDKEIFMDVNLKHYPLRDYKAMWSEMNSVVKDYAKLGKRNKQAIEHQKLGKHMMHLVRLYYMCFDILENEKIITYREKEHDLLMSIRGGKYLDSNNQPIPEFFEIVDALDKRLEYDKKNTSLPERPNYDKINEFVMSVNERVVKDKI